MSRLHGIRGSLRIVFLTVVVLMATLASSPSDGLAQSSPSISLSPGSGPPGTSVTVTGSGWASKAIGRIHWDGSDGMVLGSFSVNPNGAFSVGVTIPDNAPPTGHTIWACTDPISPLFPQICASRSFKVTGLAPTLPPVTLPPATRPPATPTPTECELRHIAGEAVIDFESFADGQNMTGTTLPQGVRFVGDTEMRVFSPAVATHSGSKALRMDYAGEFGSGGAMMRIRFTNVQDFVGMYVGLNEQIWATSTITATLTAYALDGSPVGDASVSFGPAATPIRRCLSVSAPGIVEVTLTYGGAGEPEVIDDLVLRGPSTPVPVPGDDEPPVVTILMPEDGAIFAEVHVRLQGEVRENRELAGLSYAVNMGESHELAFTPAGFTPEGEHLYLFALDPLPAPELRTCGDNLVTVEAIDASGNAAWDGHAFQMYIGDLQILNAEAVQVVYGADLVRNKATAFRVRVRSTFACDVSTRFLLELPESEWSTLPPVTGLYASPVELGWEYPDMWGPVIIPAGASDHAVMLPWVPAGQEDAAFSSANPAGLVVGRLANGVEGPDVRVVPRPIADNVAFAVAVDPRNTWPETDEANNRFESGTYPVVTTRSMCFYIVPVQSGGTGPRAATMNIKEQIEFLLATFPIPDGKVTWKVAPLTAQECPEYPGEDCGWAITDAAGFEADAATKAKQSDCDYAVAVGPWGGGSTCPNCTDHATIGHGGEMGLLAHEFNHSFNGVADMYSLDCLVEWDEYYCEYAGPDREYYCQEDTGKPANYTSANCYCPEDGTPACSFREISCTTETKSCEMYTGCSAYRRTVACQSADVATCDRACAETAVVSACDHALGYWRGPDCRIRHDTSEGFWVNQWASQPAGQTYIMDCASGPMWMRLESAVSHCEPGVLLGDGYRSLLLDPDLITGGDPQALLVRGVIHKNGEVELQPFLYLPQANLDRAAGAPGDYQFVLYDEKGAILSRTGIEVAFEGTGMNAGPTDHAHFVLRIAWVDGTRRVAVLDPAGREAASVSVTAHAPDVELLSPNVGETWVRGKAQSVRWRGRDVDGDVLTYFLDLSPDGGQSWWPIASDLTGTVYRLETGPYAAGDNYVLRVRATDGINTALGLSDGPFAIIEAQTDIPEWAFVAGIAALGLAGLLMLLISFRISRRVRPSS